LIVDRRRRDGARAQPHPAHPQRHRGRLQGCACGPDHALLPSRRRRGTRPTIGGDGVRSVCDRQP
jgi:hypothetical protein